MPLQFGMPGGVELLVILLMGLVMFGLPVLLVVVLGTLWLRSRDDYDDRIRELETEIARLQAQIGDGGRDRRSDGDGTDASPETGTDSAGIEGAQADDTVNDPTTDGGTDAAE